MKPTHVFRGPIRRPAFALAIAAFFLFSIWVTIQASTPLSVAGYLDHTYGSAWTGSGAPTGERVESKLWWNDGFWWASMLNPSAGEFHIYRLNWGSQEWEDTGTVLDDRSDTKADIIWDASANKLYVASHVAKDNPSEVSNSANWARIYRYSYDATTQTYTLDSGFPVTVNKDKTAALTLAKDANGWLWVSYVSRPKGTSDYQVYVNHSTDDGLTWQNPYTLTLNTGPDPVHVNFDDISAIIAFRDNDGDKIGVMWSNQRLSPPTLNFAWKSVTASGNATIPGPWTHEVITTPDGVDSHISIKYLQTNSSGQVFAAFKGNTVNSIEPLVGVIARDTDGSYSFHEYSRASDNDTRPVLVIDEGDTSVTTDDKLYVFVTGKPEGSKICYKSLDIKTPLSTMGDFPPGNCGESFIEDATQKNISNATAGRANTNKTTGIVILASDNKNGQVYVHNVMGDPPPVVTDFGPERNATGVSLSPVITATFSKPMNEATVVDANNFQVLQGATPVAGSRSYDVNSRQVQFTPVGLLQAETTYTVKLTNGMEDTSGQKLNQGIDAGPVIEEWSFTTGVATAEFQVDSYSVSEGSGSATITVTLNTPSAATVRVDYATSNGTATAGSDYTATSGTLTFNPGETSKSFSVPITDDGVDESNETVNLTLSNPDHAALGAQSTATLTIVDNEGTPTVQFSPSSISVDENVAGGQATIRVTLSHASTQQVTVDYVTSGGTATAGSDYTAASGTLTFNPNELEKTFTVTILDDNVDEPDETVNIQLSNPTNATLGAPDDQAVLTIVDDEDSPTIAFDSATYTVNEGGGSATLTVNLSRPSAADVTVKYATSDGTATAGSDYTTANGTLTIPAGNTSGTITVPILNDNLDEDNETVNIELSEPSNAVLGTPFNAQLTITDNDATPSVQLASGSMSVDENAGVYNVSVSLSAVSGRAVTVKYQTMAGTATADQDYAETNGTVTIQPGETSAQFQVTIIDDTQPEANETIDIVLSDPVNATLGTPSSGVLTIVDDDTLPVIALSKATYTVNEGDGSATITVTLSGPSAATVSVDYATSDGTATAGSDYTTVNSTLAIPAGSTSGTITVPILNDAQHESDETINIVLSDPVNATLGTPSSGVLTIVDDDPFLLYMPLIAKN